MGICDAEVVGREFNEGKAHLKVHPEFYQGQQATEEEVVRQAQAAYMINAVGKRVVNILIKKGIAEQEDVQWIEGIPYLQILREI